MGYYIIIIMILTGALCAFLSSILTALTIDELEELNKTSNGWAKRLSRLKLQFDETANSFNMAEMLLYVVASFLLGAIIISEELPLSLLVGSIVIYFLTILLFRTFFKAIGIRFSYKAALKFAPLLCAINFIGKPLTALVQNILKSIGGESAEEASRHEINALVESAREEGSLDPDEYRILKSIMHFNEVLVSDVMTPRTVVFSVEADKTVGEVVNLTELTMYSRFPIWEGATLDGGIIGYVLTKDVLHSALAGNKDLPLRNLSREVYFIPENAGLDTALDSFLKGRQHIFVVVDEYGGFEGLLTMEDVLETILGAEIVDEADKVVDLRELAKQRRDKRIASFVAQDDEVKV